VSSAHLVSDIGRAHYNRALGGAVTRRGKESEEGSGFRGWRFKVGVLMHCVLGASRRRFRFTQGCLSCCPRAASSPTRLRPAYARTVCHSRALTPTQVAWYLRSAVCPCVSPQAPLSIPTPAPRHLNSFASFPRGPLNP